MTFAEIAKWVRQGESDIEDGAFALMLIADLADNLDRMEHNVARMLVYSEPRRGPLGSEETSMRETLATMRAEIG